MGNASEKARNDATAFNALYRADVWERMQGSTYDLLIIGGGITGAGIALDAQSRGLRAALIDMQDFAAGTSSRSTKLVHGGLRYLKQLEIGVVAEVGKERAIVYENGPHVTTPEWMLLPFYAGGTFGRFSTSLGLRVYDFLAGVKRKERRKMLSVDQTLAKEPLLKREGMKGGGYYVEYRTDDARLTIEVLKKAVELGADAVPYVTAESFIYDGDGKVVGVRAHDNISGSVGELRAKTIINAAGPWVDKLREKDGSKKGKTLHLTKGVHLVFDQKRFPLTQAIYFDTPDGRMVFAIPREGKTYIGTTDTNYKSDIAHPRMTSGDLRYILNAANDMFPALGLGPEDVESSWTGLRPLIHQEGKDPSEISRRDEIFVSDSGLISMAGGKLTGYRKMAETAVDKAVGQLAEKGLSGIGASRTKTLAMSGGEVGGSASYESYAAGMAKAAMEKGFAADEAKRLAGRFGSNMELVLKLAEEAKAEGAKRDIPMGVMAELLYAIRYEMTVKPVDFWIRRTGNLLFDRARVTRWKEAVHAYMAEVFGWSEEQAAAYTEQLEAELDHAVVPVEAD
ncbi:glycerol-3-phosphate dehydrogenase/oxidase [Paenibacillus radicis (ex Gao et al. 2016)]|uniref:Glycerol-3-phosphate dehydrogenase n=1 Tax=Paenibacillus radicis (ex Gao et al. 2016) TaxID=1737354 RepID=A0A917LWT1_9BACL|nr:aerobic glycerol-3-phosphate dehydrogenase [Paenibacillus radicis (ex Gao et al. 2016)]